MAPVLVFRTSVVCCNVVNADAVKLVNVPAAAMLLPILVLLMVPAVAGLIVTVPVPVGLIVTVAFAGLNPTVELASNVVKLPAAHVVAPMLMSLIVPTPVEVNVRVGVLLAVSVIKFV